MPMADRTTLSATMAALLERVREELVSDPPTGSKPFRAALSGQQEPTAHARPFTSIRLIRARPIAAADDDRLFQATIGLRIVADESTDDAHSGVLDLAAAIEDVFDAMRDDGLLEGADGFDGRAWEFRLGEGTAGARVTMAEATMTSVIRVAREENG